MSLKFNDDVVARYDDPATFHARPADRRAPEYITKQRDWLGAGVREVYTAALGEERRAGAGQAILGHDCRPSARRAHQSASATGDDPSDSGSFSTRTRAVFVVMPGQRLTEDSS